jgi:hypothetical protein
MVGRNVVTLSSFLYAADQAMSSINPLRSLKIEIKILLSGPRNRSQSDNHLTNYKTKRPTFFFCFTLQEKIAILTVLSELQYTPVRPSKVRQEKVLLLEAPVLLNSNIVSQRLAKRYKDTQSLFSFLILGSISKDLTESLW